MARWALAVVVTEIDCLWYHRCFPVGDFVAGQLLVPTPILVLVVAEWAQSGLVLALVKAELEGLALTLTQPGPQLPQLENRVTIAVGERATASPLRALAVLVAVVMAMAALEMLILEAGAARVVVAILGPVVLV
jgi:hypothetical protein